MSIDYQKVENFPNSHFAVTPSDATNLPELMVIYCGSAGTISVVDFYDVAITYTVSAGAIIPVLAKRVNATGTTVTPVIGLR